MQLLVNVFLSFLLYFLLSISIRITYSSLHYIQFTHANSIVLGPYFLYYFYYFLNIPLWITIPCSICATILLMLTVNEFIFLPLQKKGAENWQMMIASLGLYVVFQNLISIIWGDSTLSFRNWEIKVGYGFLGAYVTDVQIITIFSCIFLFLGIWLFLEKTILGRRIKAFSSNMELSLILGVSKVQVVIWSLLLGTGLAASAGIMISADTDLSPTMGFNWMLYAVVVMIIGGSNRMLHLMYAALLLALSQHLVAFYLDGKWMNAVAFIFLIVFLYLRPSGFSGKQVKKNSI